MRVFAQLTLILMIGHEPIIASAGALRVDGVPWSFEYGSIFVSANQVVDIQLTVYDPVSLSVTNGALVKVSVGRWLWTQPAEPGAIAILEFSSGDYSISITAMVLTPFDASSQTRIGEFEIGRYPDDEIRSGVNYEPPQALLQVTEESQDLFVSPHFQIKQFLCKQEGDWPKYIVPEPQLYQVLEQILAAVVARGIKTDTLTVMSGYRTPFYNRSIGNVAYSRHLFGDAVDLFIDADSDGIMDDLNEDGASDYKDAELLADWIREAVTTSSRPELPGGLGIYAAAPWRGPFVHFDLRGSEVRWHN